MKVKIKKNIKKIRKSNKRRRRIINKTSKFKNKQISNRKNIKI
jgi:hypothetical protein